MPSVISGGIRFFYRLDGNEDKPVVMLVHSLGCDHSLWDRPAADLVENFRVLRFDVRGHGATQATPGDYSIELLAKDTLALADHLGIEKFALCGLSLGGMIGQWIGANAPGCLTHLILANTSARFPEPMLMDARAKTARAHGMKGIAASALPRGFLPESLAANYPWVASMRHVLLATDPTGYAGCCAAIRDMDQIPLLSLIQIPTLVIGGDRDMSTPWTGHGDVLAARIPGAKSIVFHAAHLSCLEQPGAFSDAVLSFLAE